MNAVLDAETWRRHGPAAFPPPWASAWGGDRFGLWADLAVAGVVQRLRWIEPGSFLMGDETQPESQVLTTIDAGFWLADTACTQALWLAVMGDNPSMFKGAGRRADLRRPVESVSWDDCQRFLERLNRMLRDQWTARDQGRGEPLVLRLPSEAEWERACRGGKEPSGATWVGELSGEERAPELDPIAWYRGNSGGETHPVGLKEANPYGLRDMLGNVYEWCQDQGNPYPPYTAEHMTNPVGTQGPYRVARGGSWNGNARVVRAAYRYARPPDAAHDSLGFRLAGGLTAPSKQ